MRALAVLALLCVALPTSAGASTLAPAHKARAAKVKPAKGKVTAARKFDPQLAAVLARLGEPVTLNKTERLHHRGVLAALAKDDQEAARLSFKALATSYARRNGKADVHALVQYVIRQAYLESSADLEKFATKIKAINEMKKAVRDHIKAAREATAGKAATDKVSLKPVKIPAEIKMAAGAKVRTVGQWRAQISAWERQLANADEMSQMLQLDLQDALQRKNSLLQTMSNVSKMMHDTLKTILGNIRG